MKLAVSTSPLCGLFARARILMNDAVLVAFAGLMSFLLRFEFSVPEHYQQHLVVALCVWMVIKPIFHAIGKLDRSALQYASVPDAIAIARWNAVASAVSAAVIFAFGPAGFPRSIPFLDFVLCVGAVIASRLMFRRNGFDRGVSSEAVEPVFIYGAGCAGAMLLRELRDVPGHRYEVRGLIDDDTRKHGSLVHRVAVLGGGTDLERLAKKHNVSVVLLAMPSCTAEQITMALLRCREAHLACKTMPGLPQLLSDRRFSLQIRDVSMDDVLGRTPVRLDEEGVAARIEGTVVMVTGAAGSIGSELCRQIARFRPARLVAFDIAETALFYLEQEMRASFPEVEFRCAIGNVQNALRVREILAQNRPVTIFHAAAYKHVPLMEASIFEAIENNVLATMNLALEADRYGVRDFVLISSDKAVNPANIMGATKRIAELVGAAMQTRSRTKFVSVRFGNVLGSNGSVVPTFLRQISDGGPVTVTHPEMRRYFMTIPEAAQLVVQASTLGRGGEVFVLDMGDQVRIVDLARKLILLSGLRPEKDIAITYSGIRPGEKLYEELNLHDEQTVATPHEKIRIFRGTSAVPDIPAHLERLAVQCRNRDIDGVLGEVRALVPDYVPSPHSNGPDPRNPDALKTAAATATTQC